MTDTDPRCRDCGRFVQVCNCDMMERFEKLPQQKIVVRPWPYGEEVMLKMQIAESLRVTGLSLLHEPSGRVIPYEWIQSAIYSEEARRG